MSENPSESERIAALEGDLSEVRETITALVDEFVDMDVILKRIDTATGSCSGGEADEESEEPHAWSVTAGVEAWHELANWVDGLLETYELIDQVMPCWPLHLGVVEELAAMQSAWRQAAAKNAVGDDDALAFWHDRVLVPTIHRIASGFYPIRDCRDGHRPPTQPRLTDRMRIELVTPVTREETLPSWPVRTPLVVPE